MQRGVYGLVWVEDGRWSLVSVGSEGRGKFRLLYDVHVSGCQATMRSASRSQGCGECPLAHEIEGSCKQISRFHS
jgi:hypothetical protein